ncbi:uncharacterized protein LOC107633565 [Arachis ipaensis]|uniref:uncharacterized protein LOC107633565 n=1 Tax=Arachis ipaensis TaxID=130454 RepID=UPI0007AFB6AD|nr:uncharacterized protein LOC107633565 [Arachis ipaensis]
MTNKAVSKEVQVVERPEEKEAPEKDEVALSHAPPRVPIHEPKAPHHHKSQEETKDDQYSQFLEVFKKLHINISFAETLEKMHPYVAFMKGLLYEKKAFKGDKTVVLCDLGSSINLMPLSVMWKLKIQEAQPIRIALQMADKSLRQAHGIAKNVLVKVGELFLPTDFVILDMGEDANDSIILGRPFLATGRVISPYFPIYFSLI